jgi:AbrB family looped-hinge helix DNA binding protein
MGARRGAALEISRVSTKGQVTLPKKVREAIGVGPGDAVAYDVGKGVVTLRRLEPIDLAFHAAVESTLAEWNSKEDDEAYGDL